MMAVDITQVSELVRRVTYLFRAVLDIIIAFTLLAFKVRKAVVYSILLVTALTILNVSIMTFFNRFYSVMVKYKDRRVDLSTDCV